MEKISLGDTGSCRSARLLQEAVFLVATSRISGYGLNEYTNLWLNCYTV